MIGSPDQFFVFEQYDDENAIKHRVHPHFLAYRREKTAHLVKSRDTRPLAGDRLISLATQLTPSPDGP